MRSFIHLSILLAFCVSGSLQSHTPCKRGWGRGDHFPYPSTIDVQYCGNDGYACYSKDNITLTFSFTLGNTVDNVGLQARRWTGWFYNFDDVSFGQVNSCRDIDNKKVCNEINKEKRRFLGEDKYTVDVVIPVNGYEIKSHAVQFLVKNNDIDHDVKQCIEVKFNYRG